MKIEKVNDNKIRITFNIDYLKENNIDYHQFMSNSLESQTMFLDILNEAEKQLGFNTSNYTLMLEAVATNDGNFILTVTRTGQTNKLSRKIQVKRKDFSKQNNLPTLIYKFACFDDFTLLQECFQSMNNVFTASDLYLYNNMYYLILKTKKSANISDVKTAFSTITEFASIVPNSNIFENKLKEYGKLLKNKCMNIILK